METCRTEHSGLGDLTLTLVILIITNFGKSFAFMILFYQVVKSSDFNNKY